MERSRELARRLDRIPLVDHHAHGILREPPATLDEFPLRQVAPTTTWLPGETVRDVYTLYLPPAAQAKPATLQVILYDAETLAEVGRWETALPVR